MAATSLDRPLHIIVIGGSLAGLFNATTLRRLGHKVTILERSPVPLLHDQGAGVVAGNETLEWVEQYGKTRRTAEDISVLSQQRLYLDRSGNIIDRENSRQRMTSWGVLYSIGRELFDGRHEGSKPTQKMDDVSYEYGRTVTAIEDKGDSVEVRYTQGRPEESSEQESSIQGDFLLVADGPSSRMRKALLGESTAQRKYAGYVAFRGTVAEKDLSQAATDVFVEKFSFFHGTDPNTQILAYTIPDSAGNLQKGTRLVNWVWYHNVAEDSREYSELMTDAQGNKHRYTLPTGGNMQSHVWEGQQQIARERLPPQFAELVVKTEKPFVQAITDLEPPKSSSEVARLMNGKAVIVGDALSGFRPHTAASTTQSCYHALMLNKVFTGELTWDQYEAQVLDFARRWQERGVFLGDRSQFGRHPLSA